MSQWDVKTIFGFPGDSINGLLGALNRAGDRFEFIQVRHEEMAAFMASAYAKFTGKLGVCVATSGPGASHLLTGLYDARMDHMPVLVAATVIQSTTGSLPMRAAKSWLTRVEKVLLITPSSATASQFDLGWCIDKAQFLQPTSVEIKLASPEFLFHLRAA